MNAPSRRAVAATVIGLLAVAVAALPGAAPAQDSAPGPARARAWVVRITSTGSDPVQVAEAVAEGGERPTASATALAFGGQSPQRATADPDNRDAVATPLAWNDPSGSAAFEGGVAEAHVVGSAASSRAALGTASGSGFSGANQLLTWEQQELLIGQWNSGNATVFGALNEQMATLGTFLAPLGLNAPHFEPMAGLGWIDMVNMEGAASDAEASSSEFFSSGRADARAAAVQLFGGFIEARDVASSAVSESQGGSDDRRADASIRKLRIAGIEAEVDGQGIHAARNDLFSLISGADQVLTTLLDTLAGAGLTIRPGLTNAAGDLREASALEVVLASAGDAVTISIGHAEASAASVAAFGFAPPPPRLPTGSATGRPAITPAVEDAGPEVLGETVTAPPAPAVERDRTVSPAPGVPRGPLARTLPQEAVRSLRTAYLLLVVAALLAALTLPVFAGVAGRRPSSFRRENR